MTRRYRKSPGDSGFELLVQTSATLPWWLSIGAAILLFIFVPAGGPQPIDTFGPDQAVGVMIKVVLGAIFKYLIPIGLVFGGIINLFRRGKSIFLFRGIARMGSRKVLRSLGWRDFEFLVSEYFSKQGYQATHVNAQGADGGVDIRLRKDEELYLVQCKHYKAWSVPVQIVRELYGVMAAEGAVGGFVVTTGKFTRDAVAFAADKNIELLDGSRLERLLDSSLIQQPRLDVAVEQLICPHCGNVLVKRNGSRGEFWGCKSFPKCRYTKNIA